jgi:Kef-type K+ transport system membrane component KefB
VDDLFLAISAVVVCSSLLAWLACRARQPIILAYFLCGLLVGPVGANLVPTVGALEDISRIGIVLLLFLAGLVLHPDRLKKFFRPAAIAVAGCCVFTWIMVTGFLAILGYSFTDGAIAGVALMFSSTILVVKLLPTTTLHHKRMGSICIAVLIAQDLIAVVALMFVGAETHGGLTQFLLWLPLTMVGLVAVAIVGEQFVLRKMMRLSDRYNEVLMMLCLGWCVGIAMLGEAVHIPYEVGAFVAGVAMARGKIALILSEQLKPLRDFFLMFFFFVLGATFKLDGLQSTWLPATVLAVLILASRPLLLRQLFLFAGEERAFANETGLRLGQASEFAIIIAVAAVQSGNLSPAASQMIQLTTILTFLVSSYIVVFRCPTPIGRPGLQRD